MFREQVHVVIHQVLRHVELAGEHLERPVLGQRADADCTADLFGRFAELPALVLGEAGCVEACVEEFFEDGLVQVGVCSAVDVC